MSEEDARAALAGLARAGLIERRDDVWVRSQHFVLTTPTVQRLAIYGTYRDMYAKAGEALFRVLETDDPAASAETAILGAVVSIPEDEIPGLRKVLWEMQTKARAFADDHQARANREMYLFIELFPLSSRTDDPEP